MSRVCMGLLFALCLVAKVGIAQTQTTTQAIRGDVVAINGANLQVKSTTGPTVAITLSDKVRVNARVPAKLDAITQGIYVGTTATPQPDGTLLASEVHIFPETSRGSGEGHRPMDTVPGSTMTNATVASVTGSDARTRGTTTNATVATVAGAEHSRAMRLIYKDGEKTVILPDNVPVVLTEPGDGSMLVPGAHVIVYAARQADGTLVAERISVGKDGSVPPI